MTVANNYAPIRQLGNGATTQFSAAWSMIAASYAFVQLEDSTTGVRTTVAQGVGSNQYQIAITSSGFTVTMGTAPTSSQYINVSRVTGLDQTNPYRTSKGFQGEVEEASFDKLTAMVQDARYSAGLAVTIPVGETYSTVLPSAANRAGRFLAFDGSGNVIVSTLVTTGTLYSNIISAAPAVSDTNVLAQGTYSVNSYVQEIIQNTSSGAAASADFVVNNNLGTASTYYGIFGMNSSGFTGSGSFNKANAVYLTATSGDLVIGTTTANAIRFVYNGGTTDSVTIDANGLTSNSGIITPSINGGQISGMRNRIINGDMRIAQRGTSAASNNSYALDRWVSLYAGAQNSWQQTAGAISGYSNLSNLFQLNGVAGNTGVGVYQRIESANSRDLAGKNAILSYWLYQSTGASMSVFNAATYATATDNFGSQTTISNSSTTVVPNATWTKIVSTFAIPAAAITGLQLFLLNNQPALVAGQFLQIADVQFEEGSVATTFECRPYTIELALCQRYYEVGNLQIQTYSNNAANALSQWQQFSTTKRSAPTITYSSTGYSFANSLTSANLNTNGFSAAYNSAVGGNVAAVGSLWQATSEL